MAASGAATQSGSASGSKDYPIDPMVFPHIIQPDPTTAEEMQNWMEQTKNNLLARLNFAVQVSQDDRARNEIDQHIKNVDATWDTHVGNTDAHGPFAGQIRDSAQHQAMLQGMADSQRDLFTRHDKSVDLPADDAHPSTALAGKIHKIAQEAWEDFFYYQNEWNRRGVRRKGQPLRNPPRTWAGLIEQDGHYLGWLTKLIDLYDQFRIRERASMPDTLRPEDAHRYSRNIQHISYDSDRGKAQQNKFPDAPRDHRFDNPAFRQRQATSKHRNDAPEKRRKIYHTAGKRRSVFPTSFEDSTYGKPICASRADRAETKIDEQGRPFLQTGQWRIYRVLDEATGQPKTETGIRYQTAMVERQITEQMCTLRVNADGSVEPDPTVVPQAPEVSAVNVAQLGQSAYPQDFEQHTIQEKDIQVDKNGKPIVDTSRYYLIRAHVTTEADPNPRPMRGRRERRQEHPVQHSDDEDSPGNLSDSDSGVSLYDDLDRDDDDDDDADNPSSDEDEEADGDLFRQSYQHGSRCQCQGAGGDACTCSNCNCTQGQPPTNDDQGAPTTSNATAQVPAPQAQASRITGETIVLDPTDPNYCIATMRTPATNPTDQDFLQIDRIPSLNSNVAIMAQTQPSPGDLFFGNFSHGPRGLLWASDNNNPPTWTRGTNQWRRNAVFRVFDPNTRVYLRPILHSDPLRLFNGQPNDGDFRKWVNNWVRRQRYP